MPSAAESNAAAHESWSLAQWLAWQERLHSAEIVLGLERVRTVAERLGVLRDVPPTVIVGGTNGKGSTAALLAEIWRRSGHRVGLYTSPHLRHYNERIAVDGRPATDAQICRAFERVEQVRGDVPLTYFEFGTLAALQVFRDSWVQTQVLEVGLGGRLDAVNIVDADCAILTSIGLDHQPWLGPDRDAIGFEKAGICRSGRPAIIGDPDPPAGLLEAAQARGARILRIGHEFDLQTSAQAWTFCQAGEASLVLPPARPRGAGQLRNAACALAAQQIMAPQLAVAADAVAAALDCPPLEGRQQHIGRCVLDVAHNEEAARELADALARAPVTGRTHLLLGMLADKPVEAVAAVLAPRVDRIACAGLPPPRGLSSAQLAARVRPLGRPTFECPDVAAALAVLLAERAPADRIVVTGSFLTVAAALESLHG